jgi:hypothetical protein
MRSAPPVKRMAARINACFSSIRFSFSLRDISGYAIAFANGRVRPLYPMNLSTRGIWFLVHKVLNGGGDR